MKGIGDAPSDISAEQLEAVADLAARYSFDEACATHQQNLVLPHVEIGDLYAVWQGLEAAGSRRRQHRAAERYDRLSGDGLLRARQYVLDPSGTSNRPPLRRPGSTAPHRPLKIKISGFINACGHHYVGHIGTLGVDRKGEEYYQVTLGGSADEAPAMRERTGPAFSGDAIVEVVASLIVLYLILPATPEETFSETYRRVGIAPFKEKLYAVA